MLQNALKSTTWCQQTHQRQLRPPRHDVAVDVRRFPWMRPLAGEYAYELRQRGRRSTPAIRSRPTRGARSVARVAAHPRDRDRVARPSAGAAGRRGAPPSRARRGRPPRRSRHRRRRHRPAGRRVRRSALHAAEGHHARSSWRAGPSATAGRRSSPIFWVDAEDHDWEEIAELYGARRRVPAAHRHAGRPRGRRRPAGRGARPGRTRRADHRRTRPPPSRRPNSPPPVSTRCAPRSGRAPAWRAPSRRGSKRLLGPSRPRRVRLGRPGRQAARRRRVRAASSPRQGTRQRSPPRPATRSRARGHAPQVVPQPDSVSLFRLDGGPHADQAAGRSVRRRRTRPTRARSSQRERDTTPGAIQPERAAPPDRPGHALPDHLLRGRTERARLPRTAARRLRARSACRCR